MCLLLHSSFCLFDTLLIACVTFCPYLRTVVDEGDVSTVVVDGAVAAVVDDDDGGVAAVVVAAQSNVIYHFMVPFVSANRFSN